MLSVSAGASAVTYVTADSRYYLAVASGVTQVTLSATPATYATITGGVSLGTALDVATGANTFYINVEAEDGTKKSNKVVISRASE